MNQPASSFLRETEEGCMLYIYAKPNSRSNSFAGEFNGELKVHVAAPPEDGKANKELIKFLSKAFELPKSSILLKKGETSQHKQFIILADYHLIAAKLIN